MSRCLLCIILSLHLTQNIIIISHGPGLQEIQDWLTVQENTQEFVMVHINDESHSADWGHVQLIQDPVTEIFSDLLFTPEDKQTLFPDRW